MPSTLSGCRPSSSKPEPQASRVAILQAPRAVQTTSQMTMTAMDSQAGLGDEERLGPARAVPPPLNGTGRPPGSRWSVATPTTPRCKLMRWEMAVCA